jgi:hypothetical protein
MIEVLARQASETSEAKLRHEIEALRAELDVAKSRASKAEESTEDVEDLRQCRDGQARNSLAQFGQRFEYFSRHGSAVKALADAQHDLAQAKNALAEETRLRQEAEAKAAVSALCAK